MEKTQDKARHRPLQGACVSLCPGGSPMTAPLPGASEDCTVLSCVCALWMVQWLYTLSVESSVPTSLSGVTMTTRFAVEGQ